MISEDTHALGHCVNESTKDFDVQSVSFFVFERAFEETISERRQLSRNARSLELVARNWERFVDLKFAAFVIIISMIRCHFREQIIRRWLSNNFVVKISSFDR